VNFRAHSKKAEVLVGRHIDLTGGSPLILGGDGGGLDGGGGGTTAN
jgi:hypothetical protein